MERPLVSRPRPATLVAAALALAVLGLVLVSSAADTPAARRFGRPPHDYVLRQTWWTAVGVACLGLARSLGPRGLRLLALPGGGLLLGLSAATLIPGLGVTIGGARRQLELAGLTVQPTILLVAWAPLAVAVALAPDAQGRPRRRWPLWALLAAGGAVCLRQPNFGHLATLLAATLGAVVGLGRAARPLAWQVAGLLAACAPVALTFPSVRWRVASFFQPGLTADTRGLEAILQGASLLGVGLGRGGEKALLSAAPTDYVLAVSLEELGWVGAAAAVGALLALAAGVAAQARPREGGDPLASAVACGAAASLAFPALVHLAVNLRLMPVTGIHLPLLSYSGSSTVAAFLAIGLVIGVTAPEAARPRPSTSREEQGLVREAAA